MKTRRFRTVLPVALALLLGGSPADLRQTFAPPSPSAAKTALTAALKRLGTKVPDARAVLFNVPPIEAMFYGSGTAYRQLPTNKQVAALTGRGYRVYVVDAGRIPEAFRQRTRATLIVP